MIIGGPKTTTLEHYQYVSNLSDLEIITDENVNIAIHPRAINEELKQYINTLINTEFDPIRTTFNIEQFEQTFDTHFAKHSAEFTTGHELLKKDIKSLLTQFAEICEATSVKIFFGLIDSDMCRRFHSDVNELRMLCSYAGPGTLWLTDDNINNKALKQGGSNEEIVLRQKDIKQLDTNDVAILKGALYPNCTTGGIVHRSPTIENRSQKRIMLRVDGSFLFDNFS